MAEFYCWRRNPGSTEAVVDFVSLTSPLGVLSLGLYTDGSRDTHGHLETSRCSG
jgi:hypothetical protein